jgi:hypothetical protein
MREERNMKQARVVMSVIFVVCSSWPLVILLLVLGY